ncbi:MAG: ABC transporter substrate-binding protein [Anaerolineales bacterium]
MKRNISVLLSLMVIASVLLAACGSAAPTAAPATEAPAATQAPAATEAPATCAAAVPGWDPTTADTGSKGITIAFEQEPDQAVGMFSNMSFAAWIYQMFGVGPGKWDSNNNLIGYAAAEVPSADNGGVSADGLTITYHLKPCLFWSDGEPLTSKDLAFTYKAAIDPANAPITRSGWDKIASVETPDDQTIVVTFSSLYPSWPTLWNLGPNNSTGGILPAHIFEGQTALESNPQIRNPPGLVGRSALGEWVAGDGRPWFATPTILALLLN